jgi:hypothetical protein
LGASRDSIYGSFLESPECRPAPCKIPVLENGNYNNDYESGKYVQHGTEVDYSCGGSYRKLLPGPARCELAEWRPNIPYCIHPSTSSNDKTGKFGRIAHPVLKKSCSSPEKQRGAYTYVNGLPLEWDKQFSFEDHTDVLYRCSTIKPKQKNRWKLTCEDGNWVGFTNLTCGNIKSQNAS